MKRHPGLIRLSHDHHDALVIARGLILGRSGAPRSDWPRDRRAQVDRLTAFFRDTLRPHFDAEEQWVYPLAASALAQGAQLVSELVAEHDELRATVRGLEADATSGLDERLPALGRLLEAHVRKEERVLFQAMQRELDPATLRVLGARLSGLTGGPSCQIHRVRNGTAT